MYNEIKSKNDFMRVSITFNGCILKMSVLLLLFF